jgi:iron uptake system component EfeO
VHAIERIVWSDQISPEVVAFEEPLSGYLPAAFPATEQEGIDFREQLCQRLVDDTATMEAEFGPLALDSAAAFRGVMGSMAEQLEKLNLAGFGEDESRYAQYTLGDMRANLDGGRAIYDAFVPWLEAEGAADVDGDIGAGFGRLDAAYAAIEGDAIPPVPTTWNPDDPSDADLQTPYGQLWVILTVEADPAAPGSLLAAMTVAADALGIPQLPE